MRASFARNHPTKSLDLGAVIGLRPGGVDGVGENEIAAGALTIMLTFKSLAINYVDVWEILLTLVLTFKLLTINDVDLVDLYMQICRNGSIMTDALTRHSPSRYG